MNNYSPEPARLNRHSLLAWRLIICILSRHLKFNFSRSVSCSDHSGIFLCAGASHSANDATNYCHIVPIRPSIYVPSTFKSSCSGLYRLDCWGVMIWDGRGSRQMRIAMAKLLPLCMSSHHAFCSTRMINSIRQMLFSKRVGKRRQD